MPLCDPLKRFELSPRGRAAGVPRISLPGVLERVSLPQKPLPDDPVDSAHLNRRLAALKRALDDLPGQARRLARARALNLARRQYEREHGPCLPSRPVRRTGLRPGHPPGYRKRRRHAVDDVLAECHALASEVLDGPDTS